MLDTPDARPPAPRYEFDPGDREGSFRAHQRRLQGLRQAALANPLRAGHTFALDIARHRGPQQPDARPLPAFARAAARRTLVLETPLQTQPDHRSQVWTARVADHPERVILKIIQPSMILIPDPSWRDWEDSYAPPRALAETEDIIYRRLQSVQGSTIPYYFGMHDATMPNGEFAYILVIEKIEGVTVQEWRDANLPRTSPNHTALMPFLKNLATHLLKSYGALHGLNVIHGDVRASNMILISPTSTSAQIVLVDFGGGAILKGQAMSFKLEQEERQDCFKISMCCSEHMELIRAWAKHHLPDGVGGQVAAV
ncbi:hypothetical protein BV25DRAFT_1914250 [Artomyces pyxidatus]|uniref:Uncharacterized protein n=1 Tax=Artomyces pyxidatus TaxID=48021 RepID=A0ACB8T7S4_9AGAM|nr:hypothetical protein BV25DRAFT_1914250 [Artomyces pyxidatus]